MKNEIYKHQKRFRDYQNNTNISLKNKYLYSAIDKVANSSIKAVLFKIEYASIWKEGLINKQSLRDKRLSPLLSPYQLPDDILEEVFYSSTFFRFAFVRNPYSRLLSCYLDRIKDYRSHPSKELSLGVGKPSTEISFPEFIEFVCSQSSEKQNSHWRRQYDDLMFGKVKYDYIGKFENIAEDMNEISKKIFGEIKDELSTLNENYSPRKTNSSEKVLEWYDKKTEALVFESYKEDFKIFDYKRMEK